MRFAGPLIVVRNLERSKRFYKQVLGLEVINDFGANVVLNGGISLQTLESWSQLIGKQGQAIRFGGNAGELYFEEDNIEALFVKQSC